MITTPAFSTVCFSVIGADGVQEKLESKGKEEGVSESLL